MRSIAYLWSLTLIIFRGGFTGTMLLFCLISANLFAQEPDSNAETSTASNETSSSSKSSEAPLYESRDLRDKSLLAKAVDDQAQWLDTEHGQILTLYRPTEAKMTQGVLILFHAAESPQFWPPILENLRANLPRYGWETLAVSLPQKDPAAIPPRASSAVSAPVSSSTAPEEATSTPEATAAQSSSSPDAASSSVVPSNVTREILIEAYVNTAMSFLNEKGNFNTVILVDNSSAYHVLQKIIPQVQKNKRDSTTLDGPFQALVIVNFQQQEPIAKSELETIFNLEQLPVLDIFFAPNNTEQAKSRDLHRAVAMREKVANYQQFFISNQSKLVERDHQSFLLGKVRGFMQQQAAGIEVKAPGNTKNSD